MARKVIAACGGSVRGKTIAVLGLTFKPNTDDVRDSPSLAIIPALQDNGALVRAYDPEGVDAAKTRLDNVTFAESAYACIEGADALLLLTEWDAFRGLDLDKVKELTGPIGEPGIRSWSPSSAGIRARGSANIN
jgi:UDPglucose 6-dehydrogenase